MDQSSTKRRYGRKAVANQKIGLDLDESVETMQCFEMKLGLLFDTFLLDIIERE